MTRAREIPHVLCLGGGYAAIYAYRRLAGSIRRGRLRMTVVDRNNYHCFHGLVPEMLAGKVQPRNVLSSTRRLFPRARFRNAEVIAIDLDERRVTVCRALDGRESVLTYDHLILNFGSMADLTLFPGIAEHTMRLKAFPDILQVRHHLITMLELADIETDPEERRRLLTTVVVGGNYAGVEVTGELLEFLPRVVQRRFRNIPLEEIRVVLVHGGDRVLPELGRDFPGLQRYAQRSLADPHCDLRLATRLVSATPEEAVLDTGERIPTRSIISCTGTRIAPLLTELPVETDGTGRVVTDRYCRVPGVTNVWAGGDCAAVPHPKGGTCPPLAIWAMTAGSRLAKNLRATLAGKPLRPYRFDGLGDACTLGKWRAAVHLKGVPMRGLLGYLLWRVFMVRYLPAREKKVRVILDWLLLPLFGRDLINTGVHRPLGIHTVRFEPEQTILRQGDVGRDLYMIRTGEVEVFRAGEGGGEKRLGTLGPGDHFGEVAVFEAVRRTASVRAMSTVELLRVSRDAALALSASSEEVGGLLREAPGASGDE